MRCALKLRPAAGLTLTLALVFLALPVTVWAQVDPNQERGFSPEKAYDLGQIDSVNLFNGNLNLVIPLGPEYRVNGGLSYSFMLSYNSTVWDVSTRSIKIPYQEWTRAEPDAHGTAGLGWMITLGQLYAPGSVGNLTDKYLYVSPDGGQHSFFQTLHIADPTEPQNSVYLYSRDGSF